MADPARIMRGDIHRLSAPPSQSPANPFHRAADRLYAGPTPAVCTARDPALPAGGPVRRSRPAPARTGDRFIPSARRSSPLISAAGSRSPPRAIMASPGRPPRSSSTCSTAAWTCSRRPRRRACVMMTGRRWCRSAACPGTFPSRLWRPDTGWRMPVPGRGWSSISTPSTDPMASSGWAGPTRSRPVMPLRLEPDAPTQLAQISITLPSSAASCSSPSNRASMSWLMWVRISRIGCSSPRWRRSV